MAKLIALAVIVGSLFVFGGFGKAAANDFTTKAANTGINTAVGWLDCPKAWVNETSRGTTLRRAVGGVVTGPVMCGANTAVRYAGVGLDILTLPFGKNLLKPAHALQSMQTPLGPLN